MWEADRHARMNENRQLLSLVAQCPFGFGIEATLADGVEESERMFPTGYRTPKRSTKAARGPRSAYLNYTMGS